MDNVDNNLFSFASELLLQDNEQSPFPSWGNGINSFEDLSKTILECYVKQLVYEVTALHTLLDYQEAELILVSDQYTAIKALQPSEYREVIDSETVTAKDSLKKLITEIQGYMRYMQDILKESQAIMANPDSELGIRTLASIVCQHAPKIISGKNNSLKIYVKHLASLGHVDTPADYKNSIGAKGDAVLFTKCKIEKEIEQNTNKIANLNKYIQRTQSEIDNIKKSDIDKAL